MTAYIQSSSQISNQEPLTDRWFTAPQECSGRMNCSVDASYGEFIPPMVARRMGKILKRAAAVSLSALKEAQIAVPEAIIFGTGLGCIENSEKFLRAMVEQGETCLQPTYFINSTHNTVASQVATLIKCHGYNNTYAHKGVSFESALLDCLMQFETGRIKSALVGGFDELTPTVFDLTDREGYWSGGAVAGETSVAFALSGERNSRTKCALKDVALCLEESADEVEEALRRFLARSGNPAVDLVVTGRSGDESFDGEYDSLVAGVLGKDVPEARYKHIFGESFTAGAFGVMLAAETIAQGCLHPAFLCGGAVPQRFDRVLVINSFRSGDRSFILLER